MFKKYSLNKLLVLLTTTGFAFLLLDTTLEHWDTFDQETMVLIPLVFSIICIIAGTTALIIWKDKIIRIFHILLLASFLIAATGFYFHLEDEEDEISLTAEEREHEKNEKDKPLLAPLAFGGIALVGLLGTSRKWSAEVKS